MPTAADNASECLWRSPERMMRRISCRKAAGMPALRHGRLVWRDRAAPISTVPEIGHGRHRPARPRRPTGKLLARLPDDTSIAPPSRFDGAGIADRWRAWRTGRQKAAVPLPTPNPPFVPWRKRVHFHESLEPARTAGMGSHFRHLTEAATRRGGIKSRTPSSKINSFDDFPPILSPSRKARRRIAAGKGGPAWTVECETEGCC